MTGWETRWVGLEGRLTEQNRRIQSAKQRVQERGRQSMEAQKALFDVTSELTTLKRKRDATIDGINVKRARLAAARGALLNVTQTAQELRNVTQPVLADAELAARYPDVKGAVKDTVLDALRTVSRIRDELSAVRTREEAAAVRQRYNLQGTDAVTWLDRLKEIVKKERGGKANWGAGIAKVQMDQALREAYASIFSDGQQGGRWRRSFMGGSWKQAWRTQPSAIWR